MREEYLRDEISVRRMKKSDVDYLKDHLKKEDVDEIYASHHHSPEEALRLCYEDSIAAWTVSNGHPLCVFGVYSAHVLGDEAVIWMLGTDDLQKIQRRFLRHSKYYVQVMLGFYPTLFNFVSIKNKTSIKWLSWIGAKLEPPAPYGIEGEMFQKFTFKRN